MTRKCAECDHDLFTRFDSNTNKYYCLQHLPNKEAIINERRTLDDMHLEINKYRGKNFTNEIKEQESNVNYRRELDDIHLGINKYRDSAV